jgi:hypothetical protein
MVALLWVSGDINFETDGLGISIYILQPLSFQISAYRRRRHAEVKAQVTSGVAAS